MNLNRIHSLVLVTLSAGLVACTENNSAGSSAVISVPEFAQRLNAQKSVDYGGVFAIVMMIVKTTISTRLQEGFRLARD